MTKNLKLGLGPLGGFDHAKGMDVGRGLLIG
jgi:hypothetical protein